MPTTNKSYIYSERISEADLEDMPNTLLRLSQRLQASVRRGGSDSGISRSKDAALRKADKGKGKAADPEESAQPVQAVVVPELAHLVHATGLQTLSPKPKRPRKNPLALTLLPVPPNPDLPNGAFNPRAIKSSKGKLPETRDISLGDGIAGPSTQHPSTDPTLWPPTHDPTVDGAVSKKNKPTGDSTSSSPSPSQTPTQQHNENDNDEYTLLPPSTTSTTSPSSPTTRLHQTQSTLHTANALIRALHTSVDAEREAKEDAQRALGYYLPSHDHTAEHLHAVLARQARLIAARDAEIADLKEALDYGNKLLSGSYRRQWEMWRWVDGLIAAEVAAERRRRFGGLGRFASTRKKGRGDDLAAEGGMPAGWSWESFGGEGEEPPGLPGCGEVLDGVEREERMREVLERVKRREMGLRRMGEVLESGEGSVAFLPYEEGEFEGLKVPRTELEKIEGMCAENVKTMKLGVVRMVRLVERIKGRGATGIQEPEEKVM
ncbi:hypothetical protein BU16DRAFT_558904 [Lophium mytilinum]|uniref:Uncharacterized protein n=1 Tax=Lophium mytilinum TaxID=390894 RepID=A0A6A6R2C7_9PEZI|nr:hypothetical protein BU16DRAFT_558904 [Lophium mytilinum]